MVHGPVAETRDVVHGTNRVGRDAVANATNGRAPRFVPTNIGGRAPGVLDRSTTGGPAKFAYCFGENFTANPSPHL